MLSKVTCRLTLSIKSSQPPTRHLSPFIRHVFYISSFSTLTRSSPSRFQNLEEGLQQHEATAPLPQWYTDYLKAAQSGYAIPPTATIAVASSLRLFA